MTETTPTQPSRVRKRRVLLKLACACLLAALAIHALFRHREAEVEFTNGNGAFQLESVTISQGNEHSAYFPNRMNYLLHGVKVWTGLRFGPQGFKLDQTSSVETVGLWIRWKNGTGQFEPAETKIQTVAAFYQPAPEVPFVFSGLTSSGNTPGRGAFDGFGVIHSAVTIPDRKSGLFLFLLATNALPHGDVLVRTPEGDATIHFK